MTFTSRGSSRSFCRASCHSRIGRWASRASGARTGTCAATQDGGSFRPDIHHTRQPISRNSPLRATNRGWETGIESFQLPGAKRATVRPSRDLFALPPRPRASWRISTGHSVISKSSRTAATLHCGRWRLFTFISRDNHDQVICRQSSVFGRWERALLSYVIFPVHLRREYLCLCTPPHRCTASFGITLVLDHCTTAASLYPTELRGRPVTSVETGRTTEHDQEFSNESPLGSRGARYILRTPGRRCGNRLGSNGSRHITDSRSSQAVWRWLGLRRRLRSTSADVHTHRHSTEWLSRRFPQRMGMQSRVCKGAKGLYRCQSPG